MSNRDESNTKSSQARPAQQRNDNRQTLPVLETNQAKYFRQKGEMSIVGNIFLVLSEVSYIFRRLSKRPFSWARIPRAYARIEICLSKSVRPGAHNPERLTSILRLCNGVFTSRSIFR